VQDAAKLLKVSVSTIRRQIRSGTLPRMSGTGRSVRVDLSRARPAPRAEVLRLAAVARRGAE